jgi:S-adenosylmethionine:tRNA ribosyltransferase-isomerase
VQVSDFDFELPEELIAQNASARGESRLLVLDRRSAKLDHVSIRQLPSFLSRGDVLVANDTRVIPARLLGHRVPSGGAVECLLLHEERGAEREPRGAENTRRAEVWQALMHPGQKLKPGARVVFEGNGSRLHAEVLERLFFGRRRIRLEAESGSVADAIDALGHMPLPPYIHRADTVADRERYQTVFASHRGSVAAPTAGLHFDARLLEALDAMGVERATVTLHVGYGTFKPVRAERVEDHVVDPEPYEISDRTAAVINRALDAGRRVIAIGTTTTRALEDAALRGGGRVRAGAAPAEIFIYPGFEFRVISGLLTNFHLPKSSLLMLVSAFAGRPSTGSGRSELVEGRDAVLAAYREAVAQRYRFYSYGDAMLVL